MRPPMASARDDRMRGRRRAPAQRLAFAAGCVALAALSCGGDYLRPDLVLITVAGLRPDHLHCYGGPRELGAEACDVGEVGARYVWALSTSSAGAPAAASLHSGRLPAAHGVGDSAAGFLRGARYTLAERLRDAGYHTAAFVSSPELNRSRNFQQGFDVFVDRADTSGSGAGPEAEITRAAMNFVRRARSPFFIWVHLDHTHGPFREASDPEAPNRPTEQRGLLDRYQAAIRRMDRHLSQLVAVLDAGPSEATLRPGILLVGLHAQQLDLERQEARHGASLSLEEIRVPLLWRAPASDPIRTVARRVISPVSIIDVAPTLLDAAGLPIPPALEGEPLPHDDGLARQRPAPRVLFAERSGEQAIVVGGEYLRRRWSADPDDPLPIESTSATLFIPGEDAPEALPAPDGLARTAEREARLRPILVGRPPLREPGWQRAEQP